MEIFVLCLLQAQRNYETKHNHAFPIILFELQIYVTSL